MKTAKDWVLGIMALFLLLVMAMGAIIYAYPKIILIVMILAVVFNILRLRYNFWKKKGPMTMTQMWDKAEEPELEPEVITTSKREYSDSEEALLEMDLGAREQLVDLFLANGGLTLDLSCQAGCKPVLQAVYDLNDVILGYNLIIGSAIIYLTEQQCQSVATVQL